MRLYDTISQSDLNNVIDKLLGNFHRELRLDLDDGSNDYCSLSFDLSEGVDAGTEIIFNEGDELSIEFSNPRLAELGYGIRFYYYLLDKGDYTQSKGYGELQSFTVDLDDDTVIVPFTDNQVYLQKGFDLVLMNTGESLILSVDKSTLFTDDDLTLTAFYSLDTLPVEGASVSFYNSETLVDTVVTDEDGEASLVLSDLDLGSYSFSCICDGRYSNSVIVTVLSDNYIELEVSGASFSTGSNSPFTFNGRVFVDWGDDTGLIEYTSGKLTHNYSVSDDYTVKIYGDITSLGDYCFQNCSGLTSITIPDSVTILSGYCFNGCTGLTSITIPDSVTSLRRDCFQNCSGLTSITIPDSVTNLGRSCFNLCTGLTSITIPDSVTSLGDYCLRNCTGLTSIILNWDTSTEIVTYNNTWIMDTSSSLLFHIPTGTTNLYTAKNYPSNKITEDTT